MSALRYCGEIRIRITYQDGPGNGRYRCYLTAGDTRTRSTTITVNAPAYLSHAVDSPEAFDNAARAALAFARDDRGDREGNGEAIDWDAFASFDSASGYYFVSRSEPSPVYEGS